MYALLRTEDMVRDEARNILGFDNPSSLISGCGQIMTFNQLGFSGISDKPDGWYLPNNTNEPAIVLETKSEDKDIFKKEPADELKKNLNVVNAKYKKVIGILYNGRELRVWKNDSEITDSCSKKLENKSYYLKIFDNNAIDKEKIYTVTSKINNLLHSEFGIKNLNHRMIFTACALVAQRFDSNLEKTKGLGFNVFRNKVYDSLNKHLVMAKYQNQKLDLLSDVYSEIKMNTIENQNAIDNFIDYICEISDYLNSKEWRGEDVMGIFFNEFNRYKGKSEMGQVFTPQHITDWMYCAIDCNMNDRIIDTCAGSAGFLCTAMSNMIQEAGGPDTLKAKEIKQKQLYGIEFDREIFALACANMLIHKDGKTNLQQMDTRTQEACDWIKSAKANKCLLNPPYESKFGVYQIVMNTLDNMLPNSLAAIILPDKKLEKASKKWQRELLSKHKLLKIIKFPKDLFFGVGVETSCFIFQTGVPQNDAEIFTYYIEDDGLVVVKNKGRHDVKGKWDEIKEKTLDDVRKLNNGKWIKPSEHLSYQMPEKPFEIYEEDFEKTALKYLLFKNGVGGVESLTDVIVEAVLYGSNISETDRAILIEVLKETQNES